MSVTRESLSALMDSEANELEVRRTLKESASSDELKETWRRYHLARALIKDQRLDSCVDISGRVMAEISTSEQVAVPGSKRSGFWQSAGSMAIAASVTLAVLVGLQGGSFWQGSTQTAPQAGVIERGVVNSGLMQTSLAGSNDTKSVAPVIEVIRLSEDLKQNIDQFRRLRAATEPDWSVSWTPEGYSLSALQLTETGAVRLFRKGDQVISVSVELRSDATPKSGSYSDQGIVAIGRDLNDRFVSVVGDLTLTEADRIAHSIELGTAVAK